MICGKMKLVVRALRKLLDDSLAVMGKIMINN
jgi:hypothetical protein